MFDPSKNFKSFSRRPINDQPDEDALFLPSLGRHFNILDLECKGHNFINTESSSQTFSKQLGLTPFNSDYPIF